jgi:hypothetical protein
MNLSLAALLLSLGAARQWNPSSEWKWKQVEALVPWIGLI